ncbi:MAG: prephenate dehydratase [Candidatus Rokubacteria bacterium]|nr:prephenate dehydratase [Candidatus Rokubacteria bacterium]MBI3827736.1 prephenate dehydratase [Candidatus Rokubacteria bacterium]
MDLDDWRSRINDLDNQILNLLNQRAEAALRIGDLKRRQDLPSYAPEREAEVLARITGRGAGPLPALSVRAIWREIVSACRALEQPLTVAYLAPLGTFTHQAALQHFGASVEYRPARAIVDIFEHVERGQAEFGVVPVENTTEGAVNVTLDRLIDSDAVICGERYLPITQNLLSRARDLTEIKTVMSHPQGLAQCRGWLAQNLPEVPTAETTSTAAAAEIAASDVTVAAITSELAAELYGVPILRAHIEDNASNTTRFLVVGRRGVGPTGRDKTSILFAMPNEPGALYRILEPFARAGLNLTKIESRPAKRRPWEYVMFVDFEGHRDTAPVAAALGEVAGRTLFMKVLGSYPAA